jgi:hypothetical protein
MNENFNITDLNYSNIAINVIPSESRDLDIGFNPSSLDLVW